MKYHEIAQLVNRLRDIAIEFHGAQQLRERIAAEVVTVLKHAQWCAEVNSDGYGEHLAELKTEVIKLEAALAHERLRADKGWERYESANADRNQLRDALAALRTTLAERSTE